MNFLFWKALEKQNQIYRKKFNEKQNIVLGDAEDTDKGVTKKANENVSEEEESEDDKIEIKDNEDSFEDFTEPNEVKAQVEEVDQTNDNQQQLNQLFEKSNVNNTKCC